MVVKIFSEILKLYLKLLTWATCVCHFTQAQLMDPSHSVTVENTFKKQINTR